MNNRSLQDQYIWLTGASSGIGHTLVQHLVLAGAYVAISARRSEPLEKLVTEYPERVIALTCDITQPETLQQAMVEYKARFPRLDIMILNAGTCEYLDTQQWDSQMIHKVVHTNFMGSVYTIEAGLPLLRETANKPVNHQVRHRNPMIVGICSLAVTLPFPKAEAYGASKAALKYFLESLRVDLKPESIDVSIVYPGFVKTPLTDRNTFEMPDRISAEEASKHIVNGLIKQRSQMFFPWRFATMLRLIAMLPQALKTKISANLS